ncbi:MAG: carbohydrate kinase family protein [Patescibacteria group bacterium]
MKKFQIVTIGGATRDINFFTRRAKVIATPEDLTSQKMIAFEYGAKLISEKVNFTLGGGACNASVCLARLGLKVASIACVGKDREGDSVLINLQREGVDPSLMKKADHYATGFSFVITDETSKEHVIFLNRGANEYFRVKKGEWKGVNSDWLYVTSLSGKRWPEISDEILRVLKNKKIKLVWNPGETQLKMGKRGLNKLLKFTDILILNKDESIELVLSSQGRIKGINNSRVLLKTIHQWGPKIFVLTNGRHGAYAYDGNKIYFSPIFQSKVIDTTGAGDCFGSSFLAGMILFKGDIHKAIKLGIYNTSSLVTVAGAQNGLLTKKDLKKYFK